MKSNGTKRGTTDRSSLVENSPAQRIASGNQFARAKIAQEKRHPFLSPRNLPDGRHVLTLKELQLLELLSYGYENGDIADHFQTSLQAVKNMLRTINLKLGADN